MISPLDKDKKNSLCNLPELYEVKAHIYGDV